MPVVFVTLWILVLIHITFTWYFSIRKGFLARAKFALPTRQASANQPAVSILVPAWKEKGTIEPCIAALKKIDYPDWEALILAGGPDGTFESALQAAGGDDRFRVLERGPEPKNVAVMQGVQAACYDILVILDADSLVFPDWLSRLVDPIAAGAAASFGMHYPLKETWISLAERMDLTHAYYILGTTLAQGCSSQAIRRDILNRIGPLPVNAFAWEDWDIDVRLLEAGETNAFAHEAGLLTERPVTFKEFWGNAVRCYRSHLAGLWYYRARLLRKPVWGFLRDPFLPGQFRGCPGIGYRPGARHPAPGSSPDNSSGIPAWGSLDRRAAAGPGG